jgi:hypothetical protein
MSFALALPQKLAYRLSLSAQPSELSLFKTPSEELPTLFIGSDTSCFADYSTADLLSNYDSGNVDNSQPLEKKTRSGAVIGLGQYLVGSRNFSGQRAYRGVGAVGAIEELANA